VDGQDRRVQLPHNNRLLRTVTGQRVRAASASFHSAHAARWTSQRAAAEPERYAAQVRLSVPRWEARALRASAVQRRNTLRKRSCALVSAVVFTFACGMSSVGDAQPAAVAITAYGERGANAPKELGAFAFLVGKWEGGGKTKTADGKIVEFGGVTWIGRYRTERPSPTSFTLRRLTGVRTWVSASGNTTEPKRRGSWST
jgi:hypothetical protein